jgi:hypothetical protein
MSYTYDPFVLQWTHNVLVQVVGMRRSNYYFHLERITKKIMIIYYLHLKKEGKEWNFNIFI